MIILHAGLVDQRLNLWGEAPLSDDDKSAPRPKKTSGRKKKSPEKQFLYDAGADSLLDALSTIVDDLQISKSDVSKLEILIPTIAEKPIASSPLIDPDSSNITNTSKITLSVWFVSAIQLRTDSAIDLLCKCVGRETLASGVIIGSDLAYWAKVLQFAGRLVAMEQFLPGITEIDGHYFAKWKLIISGDEARRFSLLSKSMPDVCRAMGESVDESSTNSSDVVLESFLNEFADYLIRFKNGSSTAYSLKLSEHNHIHDKLIYALRADVEHNGLLDVTKSEITELSDSLQKWRRPIDVSITSPFRLCFRLEEPIIADDELSSGESFLSVNTGRLSNWHLRYLLQASDDPSLMITVAQAWKPKGRIASLLKSKSFNPSEYLLAALGQASSLDTNIEKSLRRSAPDGYNLDSSDAHNFLTEKALLLEQSGFPVILPAWWTRKGTSTHLNVRAKIKSPKMKAKAGLSLSEIVKFDWETALGDTVLSLKELEMLAALKTPLIRMRGQWVQINPDEIQAIIEFWKNKNSNKATLRDVVQMSLGKSNLPGFLNFEGVVADGWIGELLDKLSGRRSFEVLSQPEELNGTLRAYQVRGYSWLTFLRQTGLGACLADDMGLGKSIQALSLILDESEISPPRPVLLICPTSVIGNWQKEAARFAPELSVMVHHGANRAKGTNFVTRASKANIVLSSYSLLQRDVEQLNEVDWGGVILDEAQNIKNSETKQSRAARNIKSDFRIAMTGTPVENNVGDLWAIMDFINPGFLGSLTEFKRNYFVPIQARQDQSAVEQLKRLTSPFILRRLKTDKTIISDLPEKMEMKTYCTLTKEQASLYAAVVEDVNKSLEESEGIARKGIILSTLLKLKQVCNHPAHFLADNSALENRSGKLIRLSEMLEEALTAGDKALVFTQFAEMGKIIQRHLQEIFGREVLFLHGAVPKKKRDLMVDRFQSNDTGAPSIFLLSLKAGGTGLNLTAANHVFHFDRWWNPAVENQATDRAFRIGQTRNVQVHKFICNGTLEDKIDEMIERKLQMSSKIVGTGEGWLTELSNDQLKELFKLRKEAIQE